MYRLFIIISLLLSINLYANDKELTQLEKQEVLDWTHTYCDENHKDYDSFLKDRYLNCVKTMDSAQYNHPKGLPRDLNFYERGIDDKSMHEILFFGVLYIIGIAIAMVLYFSTKGTKKDYLIRRRERLKYSIPGIVISTLILLAYGSAYNNLKIYSKDILKNGNIDDIKIALPIYNMLKLDETPLELVVSGGSLNAVKYLIEEKKYNPNENSKDKYKTNPYDLALRNKSYEISDYLKQYLPENESVGIKVASKSFDIELLKKSVELDNPTVDELIDGFLISIEYGDYKAMEYIYSLNTEIIEKEGKRIYISNATPLNVAIKFNNLKAVKFLVGKNVKFNQCGILSSLIYKDKIEIFIYLIENDANINLKCKDEDDNIFLRVKKFDAKRIKKFIQEKGLDKI